MRAAALVVLAVLYLATPAAAVTLVTPEGQPAGAPWQTWADQSLAPTVPGEVTFRPGVGPCGDVGCARWYSDGTAEIWVEPRSPEAHRLLLHELGHVFDARVMNDAGHSAWKQAIMDWRSGWMVDDPKQQARICGPPCEWFAEGYARCSLLGPYVRRAVRGAYEYVVGPTRQRRACRVLRMAAAGVFG